jgi:predicted secreted hydrolase
VKRRRFLASPLLLFAPAVAAIDFPPVAPGAALAFPRDYGSHPSFRTEWWYLTGIVRDPGGSEYGIQVTFFRSRPGVAEAGNSAFAPRQLLFAHAALADPHLARLHYDQRAARAGFELAAALQDTTRVFIGDWSLERTQDIYVARIAARDFALDLRFTPTQPVLLEGDRGYSRKGSDPLQASDYYSEPHLAVAGVIKQGAKSVSVTGSAWLDHEWSSEVMAADAVGWDWAGINLDDGTALMAFVMRGASGNTVWAGGTRRRADGRTRTFAPAEIAFVPQRRWRSARTQIDYPVAMKLSAGKEEYLLDPIFDDQELDSRSSTGTIYWEGAVRVSRAGSPIGRGYLELTGYGKPVRL